MAPSESLAEAPAVFLSTSIPDSDPVDPAPDRIGPDRIGPYRIEGRLGAGGMGEVYRAFDERLERPVALKQIRSDVAADSRARRRFEREARSAARLRHPGIVELHDLFTDEHGDWIVMELVEGRSLAEVLRQEGLAPGQVLEVAQGLAHALAGAHAEGIVHRDLKTRNVMLTPDGRPKILDFGLAKRLGGPDGVRSASITAEGQVVGTPQAMSPEQAMGRKVDLRSDLFSLGSLLYELATGAAPFAAESAMATLQRICAHHPPPIHERTSAYPRAFSELVGQLLEKEPLHRPTNAAEVASRLGRILDRSIDQGARGELGSASNGSASNGSASNGSGPNGSGPGGAATAQASPLPSESTAERRQLTVLDCRLSNEDGEGLSSDPAALSAVMAGLEGLAQEVAEELRGHVARCQGHRLELYFGYPRAQEDAARRAIHAARELLQRLESLELGDGPSPSLRAGVHTGPAVVYADSDIPPVLGRTADVAEALARVAERGEILVSDTVRRLVSSAYAVEDSGQSLPETAVFRVGRDIGASGLHLASTPMVARETEIGLLADRATRAREGAGQVALVHGEAGIGKSRLLAALKDELEGASMDWLLAQASPVHRASPLQPVIHLLGSLIADVESDPLDALGKLVGRERGEEAVPLLAVLLGLSIEGRYELPDVTPQKQREMTLGALVELVIGMAEERPLALVVEDLHWTDPTTLDWLGRLIEAARRSRLFLVLTFRPEFEVPWSTSDHLLRLDLGRLTGSDVGRLIEHVTGGRALPAEVRSRIVAKTDGVPLFVEELTKSLLESGTLVEKDGAFELRGSIEDLAIPTTLRDSLMARLDRLGRAKSVAQLAATIGREFSQQLLAAVSPLREADLLTELELLVEAELIFAKGFSSRRRYLFKHALVQDTAYESLLAPQRRSNHARIAHALERDFPRIVEQQPEVLAHHFTEGGSIEKGVSYWKTAGQKNFGNSAIVEARDYLEKGIELLPSLPSDDLRARYGLDLRLTCAETLANLEGMASSRARELLETSTQLARTSGDTMGQFWSELGIYRICLTRARFDLAMDHARNLEGLVSSDTHAIFAKYAVGLCHYFRGEHLAAGECLEQALECYDPQQNPVWASEHAGEDPGIVCFHFASVNSWFLGYPDKAIELTKKGLELAQRTNNLYGRTYMTTGLAMLRHFMRDFPRALEASDEAIRLSSQHGSWWSILARIYHSSAKATLDSGKEHDLDNSLKDAIGTYHDLGMRAQTSKFHVLLAESLLMRKDYGAAASALDESMRFSARTGEGFYEAEAHRIRGRLELSSNQGPGGLDRAEREFCAALASAERRGAKMLELRAALDLGRIYLRSGRSREAIDLVARRYEWFSEGFDCKDLETARDFLRYGESSNSDQ